MNHAQLDDLLTGRIATLTLLPDGNAQSDDPPEGALLSGSFNPLHAGHLGMADATRRTAGLPVAFELPVINADKGQLSADEIVRRAEQFAGRETLVLSRAPRFVDKVKLFPGRLFVLGYDTAVRLIDPRYYDGNAGLIAGLNTLRAAGCRFLVAGRMVGDHFATIDDLVLPAGYGDLFAGIPESFFRADISSTELRRRAQNSGC
ncbi:MAG: hypothetical protein HC822_19815 [Oscillochloris sp.]|nr:hypothetical protein [Oscillochloris sp.]